MLWRWTLSLVFTGLLQGLVVPVIASPIASTPLDNAFISRREDPTAGVSKVQYGSHGQQNARSLTLEVIPDGPPNALTRRDDNEPWYRIAMGEDPGGCYIDACCWVVEYISTPILALFFGINQIVRGPHLAPGHLLSPILILACRKIAKIYHDIESFDNPPRPKNDRSLTLEATPHKPLPDAIVRRDENEPWYKFCKRDSTFHCVFEANCFVVKYISAPIGAILFGIMQVKNGLHFGPGYLVPPILFLACQKLLNAMDASDPPQQKNGRSLTLEATPHRPPPDALIRRVENEPWYKFCKRASILHCFFDANCFAIKYVATPLGVILFGIMQIENGLHFGPGYLVPPILILACQKLLNAMDASDPPKPKNGRSLTLEAPSISSVHCELIRRDQYIDDSPPMLQGEHSVMIAPRTNPKEMMKYFIYRREDGQGCWLDAGCWIVKYVFSPTILIMFGANRMRLGPQIDPLLLIPPFWVIMCFKLQRRQDAEFDAQSSTPKRSFPPTLPTPPTFPPPSALSTLKGERSMLISPLMPIRAMRYHICRRVDGQGYWLDAACWVVKYVFSPIFVILFGLMQMRFGPHVDPTALIPPIWVLIYSRQQRKQDEKFDNDIASNKPHLRPIPKNPRDAQPIPERSPPLTLSAPPTSSPPSALVPRFWGAESSDWEQTYSVCQAGLDKRCGIVGSCWLLERIGSPLFYFWWGVVQRRLGPTIGPGILLPAMGIALCRNYRKRTKPPKGTRALTLDAPLPSQALSSLVRRQDDVSWYEICHDGDLNECIVDINCTVIRYFTVPSLIILFGLVVVDLGLSAIGPSFAIPAMLLKFCSSLQNKRKRPKSQGQRRAFASLQLSTLEAPLPSRAVSSLVPRQDDRPWYEICQSGNLVECIEDIDCIIIRYMLVPSLVIMFGFAVMEMGLQAIGPGFTMPGMLLKLCSLVQNRRKPPKGKGPKGKGPKGKGSKGKGPNGRRRALQPPMLEASAPSAPDTLSGKENHGEATVNTGIAKRNAGFEGKHKRSLKGAEKRSLVKEPVWTPGYFSA